MDMALALRTMGFPPRHRQPYKYSADVDTRAKRSGRFTFRRAPVSRADSNLESEYQETVNKAAALGRAIDLAEEAFDV